MAELQQSAPEGKNKTHARKSLHIDMTPMVDLAFLLLTFFVMTSELTKPFALKLEMPQEEGTPPPIQAGRVLNIILGKDNKVYWYQADNPHLEQTSFSAGGVRKLLLKKNAQIQKLYVLIKPSDESTYKNVVDILDEIMITEIERYALVKMESDDTELLAQANIDPQ